MKEREYTEDNVDPNYTYRVRIRTKIDHYCLLNTRDAVWSEWSHVVSKFLLSERLVTFQRLRHWLVAVVWEARHKIFSIFVCVCVFMCAALEQSLYTHSVSMIILILLGIPPIFLAMLLLWRYQRYCLVIKLETDVALLSSFVPPICSCTQLPADFLLPFVAFVHHEVLLIK